MKRRKILRQIECLVKQLDRRGALEPEQREAIDRALSRIKRGLQRRDQKLIEDGIGHLVRALLRAGGLP